MTLESARRPYEGLHGFRSVRQMARTLRLGFSQSLASLRQRFSRAIARSTAQPTVKAGTIENPLSWLFISGTLLLLASVIRMWIHWPEISAVLGFYRAAGALTAVTGAALIVSCWLNTGNE